MSEKFNAEELQKLRHPNSSMPIWSGAIISCPFCKTMNFRFMGEAKGETEFNCTNCWFGGSKKELLNGETKREQANHYKNHLENEIKRLEVMLKTIKTNLARHKH